MNKTPHRPKRDPHAKWKFEQLKLFTEGDMNNARQTVDAINSPSYVQEDPIPKESKERLGITRGAQQESGQGPKEKGLEPEGRKKK